MGLNIYPYGSLYLVSMMLQTYANILIKAREATRFDRKMLSLIWLIMLWWSQAEVLVDFLGHVDVL